MFDKSNLALVKLKEKECGYMLKSNLNLFSKKALKQKHYIQNFTSLTQKAILKAEAEENNLTDGKTPGFTSSKKLITYMKKRAKDLK